MITRMFIGRLFTSIGPVNRYAKLRRERGESTTVFWVFWLGWGGSVAAALFLLLTLGAG